MNQKDRTRLTNFIRFVLGSYWIHSKPDDSWYMREHKGAIRDVLQSLKITGFIKDYNLEKPSVTFPNGEEYIPERMFKSWL